MIFKVENTSKPILDIFPIKNDTISINSLEELMRFLEKYPNGVYIKRYPLTIKPMNFQP